LSPIDRLGAVVFTLESLGDDDDGDKLVGTTADPSDGSVCAIRKHTLKHYSPDGQLWQSLKPMLAIHLCTCACRLSE
jgi:hypothetical protein